VVDASVAIKWFLPERYAEAAGFLQNAVCQLHAPAFLYWMWEMSFARKSAGKNSSRKRALPSLKNCHTYRYRNIPTSDCSGQRLRSLINRREVYGCMYLALAETINGQVVTADRKLYAAIAKGPYGQRVLWVEDLVRLT